MVQRPSCWTLGARVPTIDSKTANHTLVLGAVAVAASTVVLPWVGGYGTVLFQVVVLEAWRLLSAVTSDQYADLHHGPLWMIALALNVTLFLVPAAVVWFAMRHRWPKSCATAIIGWCALYLASLFFLFPATDGP